MSHADDIPEGAGADRAGDLVQAVHGFNLILDGVDDTLKGLLGATAGTNYGENNSLMAITRNYSGPALIAAGGWAAMSRSTGRCRTEA